MDVDSGAVLGAGPNALIIMVDNVSCSERLQVFKALKTYLRRKFISKNA